MLKSYPQIVATNQNIRKFLSNNNRFTSIIPITATGGTVFDANGFRNHVFTTSSTPGFNITSLGSGIAEILVVAGGGGGGSAGGGGGGFVSTPYTFTATGSYPITVGGGGSAGKDGPGTTPGTDGGESWIGPPTSKIAPATGGGGGGATDVGPTLTEGRPGGSGGGAGVSGPGLRSGGIGIFGQGFPGGGAHPYVAGDSAAGGGGGAGGAGTTAEPPAVNPQSAGPGGIGLPVSWLPAVYGTPGPQPGRYFSGGGGGGSWGNPAGTGGAGGGGVGGSPTSPGNVTGTPGTVNTGGGGGGAGYPPWNPGGNGGSGIVVIRYIVSVPDLITNGLQLYLDASNASSYPGSGSTWFDISGNNRNATINGSPTFVGTYFDSFNDSNYISLPNAGLIPRTNDFTYSIWIYFNSVDSLDTIFENGSWTDTLLFRFESNQFTVYSEGALRGNIPWTATTGSWVNIVLIRESNTVSCYINDVLTGTPFTMNLDIDLAVPTMFLMRSQHTTGQSTNGRLSVFKVYNRALTRAQITQNFNALRGRFGV